MPRMRKRACIVCDETKYINQFPSSIKVNNHQHGHNTCRTCYFQHVQVEIDKKMWDQISCPECSVKLVYHQVKYMSDAEHFTKYDQAAFRSAMSLDHEFRYCMSSTCDSGQSHPGGVAEPIFCCQICRHKHCVSYEVNWHEGQTCEQFRGAGQQRTQDEEESNKRVEQISKPFSGCKSPIEKNNGCDHMSYVATSFVGSAWPSTVWSCNGVTIITTKPADGIVLILFDD
ncbi:hypothetical protein E4T39_06529 [Aureobasidium subglaciale]|nr:hypothetical protein E4T39_06529 [Aureobasidium subglaciale]